MEVSGYFPGNITIRSLLELPAFVLEELKLRLMSALEVRVHFVYDSVSVTFWWSGCTTDLLFLYSLFEPWILFPQTLDLSAELAIEIIVSDQFWFQLGQLFIFVKVIAELVFFKGKVDPPISEH